MNTISKRHKNNCRILSFRRAAFLCLICVVFAPLSVTAKTLAEHQKNLQDAGRSVIELLYPNDEDMANKNYPEFERRIIGEIREKIPASEKIEWKGTQIETNNQWLGERLNEFEKETKNPLKRAEVLNEISERLSALEQKINELENVSVAERSKDENKQKLAEILRREEYQKPSEKQESLFQKLYRKFTEWLESIFPRLNLSEPSTTGFQSLSFILQMILYALVLGIIGFLIYRFAPLFVRRFRSREKKEKKERVILGERLSANETAQNIFAEAENLARTGNLRGAIRKGYIALLCELNDRKIIGLSRHKTNRDYLRDVSKCRELYENMKGLTSNFERHWYGFDPAQEKDWEEFRNGYKQIITN